MCQNRGPLVNQQPFNEHICSIQFSYVLSSRFVQSHDRGCRDVNVKQIESWPPEAHKDEDMDTQVPEARPIAMSILS